MKTFSVTLTGSTPLILHRDSVEWADEISAWRTHPENKKTKVPGDDRSPAWSWVGSCYHDDEFVGLEADNIMRTIRDGGALVPVPGGRSGKTFKSQSQSGLIVNEPLWPIETAKGRIPWADVAALVGNPDFREHQATASRLGFEAFVKRAPVGMSKHIRVRPKFHRWSCAGTITVIDEQITPDIFETILRMAGALRGLGDWRPSAPKSPGAYGKFIPTIKEV